MTSNSGIKWIMLVSGALTVTMVYAAVAPDAVMRSTFGETLDGNLAGIVVRSWGVLIGLVGAMLIYGAYRPAVRSLTLVVASVSKLAFIALVLLYGQQYMGTAGLSVGIDLVMVVLFAAYLIGTRRDVPTGMTQ
jgi:hypothetical protein